MRKLCSLLLSGLLGACAGLPVIDQPTKIASRRLERPAAVEARAVVDSRDRKPTWVRLYVIPAAHADEAQSAIAASAGQLGRWALFPLVSISLDGQESASIRLGLPASAVHAGDLVVLAIDPISPGRFLVSKATVTVASSSNEVA